MLSAESCVDEYIIPRLVYSGMLTLGTRNPAPRPTPTTPAVVKFLRPRCFLPFGPPIAPIEFFVYLFFASFFFRACVSSELGIRYSAQGRGRKAGRGRVSRETRLY